MRKKSFHRSVIISVVIGVVGLAVGITFLVGDSGSQITVVKRLSVPLANLSPVYVDAPHDYCPPWVFWDGWTPKDQVVVRSKAKTVIRFAASEGWSLPEIGHFNIIWKSIKQATIEVIDQKTGTVLGKVEFRRSLRSCPSFLNRKMFSAMVTGVSGRVD